jgi:hypothetical protein
MVHSAHSVHDRQLTTRIILELFDLIGIDDVFHVARYLIFYRPHFKL